MYSFNQKMGNYYVKLKVKDYTVSFMYQLGAKYIQRTIAIHPDNSFNKEKKITYECYKNYSGDYYIFDGDYNRFDHILKVFIPKKDNLKPLLEQLSCECDLEEYKNLWTKACEWATSIVGPIIRIPFKPITELIKLFLPNPCTEKLAIK